MKGEIKSGTRSRRSPGFALLREVYDELYRHLGDDYSPAELLRAAQTLIEVTDEEYGQRLSANAKDRPGYYSFAVDWMMENRQWWLYDVEQRRDHLGDDRLCENYEAIQRLKRLYNPDRYFHRG